MQCSVIIPVYNRADLIKFTLNSLNADNHPGVTLEIIVVDDGSTDNVIEVVRVQFPHVVVKTNNGKGAPAARNTGLAAAKSKYIQYLDSDDLVGPGYFLAKINYLESHNEVNACYGAYEFFSSDEDFSEDAVNFKHKYPAITQSNNGREHLLNYLSGNYLPPNAIIWRRDFLVHIHGHDTSLNINQDVELVIRAVFNGLNMVALNDGARVLIRDHNLDIRVGNASNEGGKWVQVLKLRKRIFGELEKYGYSDIESKNVLSTYIFDIWKSLRHSNADVAAEYLKFAKEVYWPVIIKGNIIFRTLGALLGPVKAVELKYLLLKRD